MHDFHVGQRYQIPLENGQCAIIERLGLAVARIYFVDERQVQLPIPPGVRVTDRFNGDIPVHPIPERRDFVLLLAGVYSLFFQNKLLATLTNQCNGWRVQ